MQITSSYAVEIINNENTYKLFNPTIKIYNNAISFCIICFEKEWVEIEKLSGHKQFNYCENLIHSTSRNIAKYSDFDKHFYKFPSYIRRDVVSKALGHVKSYHSNLKNWQTNGCKDKEPKLQINVHEYPTFFRRDFYIGSENKDTVQIKLYLNNDWVWKKIRLKRTDLHYLEKYWNDAIKDELIYLNNSNKKEKTKIINDLILAISKCHARFLKKDIASGFCVLLLKKRQNLKKLINTLKQYWLLI